MMKPQYTMHAESKPPKQIEDVERIMTEMDQKYKTTFKAWIKNQGNVSFICSQKRYLFTSEFNRCKETGYIVMNWIFEDWSTASISEFLYKMFPNNETSSPIFAQMIRHLTLDWDYDRMLELISLILVGESAYTVSRFLYSFSSEITMTTSEISRMLKTLSMMHRWTRDYQQSLLLHYIETQSHSPVDYRQKILMIYDLFEEKEGMKGKLLSQVSPVIESATSQQPPPNSPDSAHFPDSLQFEINSEQLSRRVENVMSLHLFLSCFEQIHLETSTEQ